MRIKMNISSFNLMFISYLVVGLLCTTFAERCRFRPMSNDAIGPRIVKIAEDAPLQLEVFRFEVWPRTSLILEPVSSAEDKNVVALKSISTKRAILILNRPLKVLGAQNRTSARYRLTCYGSNNTEPDVLSLVLNIDDVNYYAPELVSPPTPNHVVIEESVTAVLGVSDQSTSVGKIMVKRSTDAGVHPGVYIGIAIVAVVAVVFTLKLILRIWCNKKKRAGEHIHPCWKFLNRGGWHLSSWGSGGDSSGGESGGDSSGGEDGGDPSGGEGGGDSSGGEGGGDSSDGECGGDSSCGE